MSKYFSTAKEKRNKEKADISIDGIRVNREKKAIYFLLAFDLNKNINIYDNNKKQFANFLNTQRLLRDVDGIFLINNKGKLIFLNSIKKNLYQSPSKEALKMVENDNRPLKILNAYENTSAALMRLSNYENTFVYVVKLLDPKISKYLTQSKNLKFLLYRPRKRTGIKISFAIIYMIVVTLLLFLSISIAIRFSSRFFRLLTILYPPLII